MAYWWFWRAWVSMSGRVYLLTVDIIKIRYKQPQNLNVHSRTIHTVRSHLGSSGRLCWAGLCSPTCPSVGWLSAGIPWLQHRLLGDCFILCVSHSLEHNLGTTCSCTRGSTWGLSWSRLRFGSLSCNCPGRNKEILRDTWDSIFHYKTEIMEPSPPLETGISPGVSYLEKKSGTLVTVRKRICLRKETWHSCDSLSDHLVRKTGTETVMTGRTTSWPGQFSYFFFHMFWPLFKPTSYSGPWRWTCRSWSASLGLFVSFPNVTSLKKFPFSTFHLSDWPLEDRWLSLTC